MAKILLIESDHILADGITKILGRDGHRVNWYTDLQAATDSVDEEVPQLIIMDLMLGGRSGAEFLYELRSYPEWQRLPVVIYSNVEPDAMGSDNVGFRQLAIAAYHYKPTTSLSQLLGSVNSILQSTRA